ncbi:hypothetical protein CANMA_001758 [Candida margitis]|uniref:uncharacterized protein n=1 Tax=Candida margitis TaxID=1775924 RepID=UPI002225E24B|nr:uncharacterized protein CANMA_001758 [Candida margitis]KAI5969205.1 hypothetical protein CANMA_001758 [Candida margitis]
MAKKSKGVKKSGKNRSSRKIIDAYQIAERQERKSNPRDFDDDESDNDVPFEEGILDARKFLQDGQQDEDLLDEDIDSDEALASDDDYDVLNSKFSQTIRDKAKRRKLGQDSDSDLDDEDEEYDSIDEGQLVTLSEAWDMDDRDLAQVKGSKDSNELVLNDDWVSESSSSGEEDDDDEEDGEDDEGVEEDWGDTTKASTSDSDSGSEEGESEEEDVFAHESDDDNEGVDLVKTTGMLNRELETSKPKERKKFIAETRAENEFSVPSNGQKLSLSDMMKDVSGVDNILIDQDAKAVATPLPKRIQQRNDRGAAYDLAKKEVSKWSDTVQQNRQAEVLKFPMQQPDQINDSVLTFRADNHVPTTSLEKKVNDLLTQSALVDDKKEATFEEIAMAKMSPEEMRKRTNELKLMRELMFRDERRAKRLKKIKSKQYHKIKKRERLRNQELGDEVEDVGDEGEDHDMERAKERMSLKHKTQSKWAQSMIKSGLSKDASNREELEEMLRQGERLREKQLGRRGGDGGDDDDEGFYSDDNLDRLEREYVKDGDDVDRSKIGKGVMAMDFMKNAEKRKKEENLKQIEQLRRLESGEDTGIDLFEQDNGLVNVKKNTGRRVYNAAAIDDSDLNEDIMNQVEDDNAKSLQSKINKVQVVEENQNQGQNGKAEVEKVQVDESNPWLASTTASTNNLEARQKSSKITTMIDENSSKLAKAAAKIAKRKQKNHNDTESLIDVNNTLAIADIHKDDGSDDGEEIDIDSVPTMFKQKDLIKEAFVGDDVTSEFQSEKKRMIEDEDDKEEDVTLPGWGDWTGGSGGAKSNKKKRKFIRKIDGVTQRDKRKDKNLSNVIINEKLNKKILKYQSSDVPYPFETREQYEQSLRMPLGQEWTSRETHQKLTMPRVITKQGVVIDPLKAPFK